MLTGKAKSDFEKWLLTDGNEVIKNGTIEYDLYYMCKYMIPQNMVCAKIVEWLDSIGIYVEPYVIFDDGIINFSFNISGYEIVDHEFAYITRQQATEQAIIKANEIYNGN